jgi:hypothetical protein
MLTPVGALTVCGIYQFLAPRRVFAFVIYYDEPVRPMLQGNHKRCAESAASAAPGGRGRREIEKIPAIEEIPTVPL